MVVVELNGNSKSDPINPELFLMMIINEEGSACIVAPVKPVSVIPPYDRSSNKMYINSRKKDQENKFVLTMCYCTYAMRANREQGLPCPRSFPAFEYVPPTEWYEIDFSKTRVVSFAKVGKIHFNLTDEEDKVLRDFIDEKAMEHRYSIPERVAMFLDDDEHQATKLTRWSKRKRAVLKKLLEKFTVQEVSSYFGVQPEVINIVSKKP